MREKLVKERALVEAGIGAVKSSRYNFHRPRARSMRMMGVCGQLALLGFNLNKLARGWLREEKSSWWDKCDRSQSVASAPAQRSENYYRVLEPNSGGRVFMFAEFPDTL
jgi:hypothetical protein